MPLAGPSERVAVVAAPDGMSAWATVVVGAVAGLPELEAALAKAGVCFGIDEAARATLAEQLADAELSCPRFALALGQPPVPGRDGWFEPAFHVGVIVPPVEPGACVGIITVKDIVQLMCDGESGVLDQLRVADAMSTPAVSVQHAFSITDCLRLMRIAGVRSAPVLDGVRLVGLLSFTDVVRAAARESTAPPP